METKIFKKRFEFRKILTIKMNSLAERTENSYKIQNKRSHMAKINGIDEEKKQTMKTGNTGRKQVQKQRPEKPQGNLRKRTSIWTQGMLAEPTYTLLRDHCVPK